MNDENERMWSYIAGCVDCDGWISKVGKNPDGSVKRNYAVVVGITQHVKCKEGMETIAKFMRSNGISVTFTDRDSNTHHQTPMINITVKANASSLKLLERIEGYMLFKHELARECIQHLQEKQVRLKKVSDSTPKSGSKKRYWSDSEFDEALSLQAQGYNHVAIGEMLGRSVQSVAQKFHRELYLAA